MTKYNDNYIMSSLTLRWRVRVGGCCLATAEPKGLPAVVGRLLLVVPSLEGRRVAGL